MDHLILGVILHLLIIYLFKKNETVSYCVVLAGWPRELIL